jgi:two-component system OmpR family response regulator
VKRPIERRAPVRDLQLILYVDDDPDICCVVRATLRLVPGLNVQIADSGERAIDLAYELRPDLVLMDVMMPGLDGPSTFKRMRDSVLLAEIPVIFLTAKVLPAEIAQLLQLGAIGVIVKPFDPLKLYSELFSLWNNGGTPRRSSLVSGGPAAVQAQVDSLTVSFLQRVWTDVINLAQMIEQAQAGDQSVFPEIERVCHSIYGAGAMFGFPRISEVAGAMMRIMASVKTRSESHVSASGSATLQQLLEAGKQLAQEVESAWQISPQPTAMFQGPVGVR